MKCVDILRFFFRASALNQTLFAATFRRLYDLNFGYRYAFPRENLIFLFGFDIRSFTQDTCASANVPTNQGLQMQTLCAGRQKQAAVQKNKNKNKAP